MVLNKRRSSFARVRWCVVVFAAASALPLTRSVAAQGLTGALIGTVKDEQGGALPNARVQVSSPALMGGSATQITNEKGQLRFPLLPPGSYTLDIELSGFKPFHEEDIRIGAGATIERTAHLTLEGLAESIVVEGKGSRIEARDPGFATRFGPEDLNAIPTRRASIFDFVRATPGISPTSPASGTATTVSAFGSGTNENQFLFDGTNITCPCNGVSRPEPGVDFVQEVQIQAVGASAEYGNLQGAVVNVITRQGSDDFLYDASFRSQTASLTSQPVVLPLAPARAGQSGYERARYRELTTNLGGPVVRERLWFFAGYQYLRDEDSQPGTDPALPRAYAHDKIFAKLTWKLTPSLQLVQSVHDEYGVIPDRPTAVTPFEATSRPDLSVPAITFGHLTHTLSANTVWDVRAGRFVYSLHDDPDTYNLTTSSRFDRATGITSNAPPQLFDLTIIRTTTKATISHYRPGLWGADHQLKMGGQIERGEHHASSFIPTGVRYEDKNGEPLQSIASDPANVGGVFISTAAFASDAVTIGDRLTINTGVRFDRTRAISQDLHAVDGQARQTDAIVPGRGTLYTWNIVSPRLGVTTKLTGDGRTMLRASYGRFSQGVLTGELQFFHPGATPVIVRLFSPATGGYTGGPIVVDPNVNLQIDPHVRAPHTDEYAVGVDREIGRRLAVAVAYVHKDGANFIGWTDVAGVYTEGVRPLPDGSSVPVFALNTAVTPPGARRFRLTNADGYSMTYNGLVMVVEKRRSNHWQAFGSYTLSRTYGLLPSSGGSAASAQVSTISPPQPLTFGRDPNDLTNARGRLPNDRPHMFRVMGSVDVQRTGLVIAANLQYLSGKPWAAAAQVTLPQEDRRILLEPRGSRRLASQSLLDVRVSRTIRAGGAARIEVFLDILNALNDTAAEGLATDILTTETARTANFGQATVFMDPRRAMLSVRMNLGR